LASDYSSIGNKLNQLGAEIALLRNLPALSLEFTTWPSKLFALVEAGLAYWPSSIPWKAEAEAYGVRLAIVRLSTLEDMQGWVVLYFYPKSFTSVCTIEAHEFAENIENFAAAGATVIGVSGDKIEVQRDFSTKECRDKFPVGADPSFSVIKAYDAAFTIPVAGAVFANRISYVISPEGTILYAYADSNAEKYIENTLAVVRKWLEEHKR
jgi:thioredoxin-dependent peroxiredoxin